MDEIAEKLQAILAEYGPRSIASYNGTYSYQNSAAHAVARAWHRAIGPPSFYTSVTIDQPAKVAIGPARMGWWNAGSQGRRYLRLRWPSRQHHQRFGNRYDWRRTCCQNGR